MSYAIVFMVGVLVYFLYQRHPAYIRRVSRLKNYSRQLQGQFRKHETVGPENYPPVFAYSPARITKIRIYNTIELNAEHGIFKFFDCRSFNELYGGYISMVHVQMKDRRIPYFLLCKDKLSSQRLLPSKIKYYGLYGTKTEAVEQLFHPRLIDFINESPQFDVEGYGDVIIVYDPNYKIPAHDVSEMFAWSRRLVSLIESPQERQKLYQVI